MPMNPRSDNTPPTVADPQVSLRSALLEATVGLAYTEGFDGISLRSVSGKISKSTTVIFQHFGGRQGLIDAALDHALAHERLRHDALLAEIDGFPNEPMALAELVAYYVKAADRDANARFCLEAMLHPETLTDPSARLQQWSDVRGAFWKTVTQSASSIIRLLADYTVMEQAFCTALRGEPAYDQLLRTTARAACLGRIPFDPEADDPILGWARQRAFPALGESTAKDAPMEPLVVTVAQRIANEGINAINLRRIALDEGVPPSLIIYHYGDFAAFLSAAIWRAMMHELPAYLDQTDPTDDEGRANWLAGLRAAVTPGPTGASNGFYVRYARILGQVCLLARQRPELVPLVRQLRAIEGMGIHRASLNAWPREFRLDPAAASTFSIWIKSHALSRISAPASSGSEDDMAMILRALIGNVSKN
ncbi:TetR/AcrR family transcriptional regulator [Novosphingobium resinovorum]|uniref:TetR/AcrR family transcriptional regulator n=1 Tax=Novosphingobium resinovorum TaxID=158500 RepID=UPI002ED0A6F3|nr:TetR/AcrR family transcriptional regulator [Novosphingobium resinovorum]